MKTMGTVPEPGQVVIVRQRSFVVVDVHKSKLPVTAVSLQKPQHLVKFSSVDVSLTLILETAEESEGQLNFDALNAFSTLPKGSYSVYCWPSDRRPRNAAGRPGKLHVKCAVVDSTALVGSGNLTEDAFNRNMELGLLVNDAPTADVLYSHFTALIARNEFCAKSFEQ